MSTDPAADMLRTTDYTYSRELSKTGEAWQAVYFDKTVPNRRHRLSFTVAEQQHTVAVPECGPYVNGLGRSERLWRGGGGRNVYAISRDGSRVARDVDKVALRSAAAGGRSPVRRCVSSFAGRHFAVRCCCCCFQFQRCSN